MKLMGHWERKVAVLANLGGFDTTSKHKMKSLWGPRVSVPSLHPLGPGEPGLGLEARVRHLRGQAMGDSSVCHRSVFPQFWCWPTRSSLLWQDTYVGRPGKGTKLLRDCPPDLGRTTSPTLFIHLLLILPSPWEAGEGVMLAGNTFRGLLVREP